MASNSPRFRRLAFLRKGRDIMMDAANGTKYGKPPFAAVTAALRSRGLRLITLYRTAERHWENCKRNDWIHVTVYRVGDESRKPEQRWVHAKFPGPGIEVALLPTNRLTAIKMALAKQRGRETDRWALERPYIEELDK